MPAPTMHTSAWVSRSTGGGDGMAAVAIHNEVLCSALVFMVVGLSRKPRARENGKIRKGFGERTYSIFSNLYANGILLPFYRGPFRRPASCSTGLKSGLRGRNEKIRQFMVTRAQRLLLWTGRAGLRMSP